MPSIGLSAGATGMMRNADSISTLARKTVVGEDLMNLIASWIEAYCTVENSRGIKSLTDVFYGYDR